jgi:hypothetical protein
MRAAFIATLILLLPAALLAAPTMGVYFTYTPDQMNYSPTPYEQFTAYIFAHHTECYLDAAEFQLGLPPGISMITFTLPPGTINIGDPIAGIAVAYWPPMDGWNPGYNLMCTVTLLATDWCWTQGGTMHDASVMILPNPSAGAINGSCWPDNDLFQFAGLTSILCPDYIATQEKSWGAIKSLF